MKRLFDIALASLGILFLSPLFLVLALLIKLDSPGPVLFLQERLGLGFRPFRILKFRTMIHDASAGGLSLTVGEDRRITRVGRILRRLKLDELPQLLNVLRGDMSLVGPRPEVPRYVKLFLSDYETLLTVRPGLTDFASITFANESTLLGKAEHPEEEYIRSILPEKIRLSKEYVRQSSLRLDVQLLFHTVFTLLNLQRDFRHHDRDSLYT